MYITRDDYMDFSGIDLQIELRGTATDNPSRAVEIFIERVEEWILDYLAYKYNLTKAHEEFDATVFGKAVLHQIDYIRRNGELSIDTEPAGNVLSPNAYNVLKAGGMCNSVHHRQEETLWQ